MTLQSIKFTLGDRIYNDNVSTDDCTYVDDFKSAIKTKFSHLLNLYAPHHLTLFQPDGKTENCLVTDLKETPEMPMIVTAVELPIPAHIRRSKKQLKYNGMSSETSCRNYFDALAARLALFY